jgi:hypothetical protein
MRREKSKKLSKILEGKPQELTIIKKYISKLDSDMSIAYEPKMNV